MALHGKRKDDKAKSKAHEISQNSLTFFFPSFHFIEQFYNVCF